MARRKESRPKKNQLYRLDNKKSFMVSRNTLRSIRKQQLSTKLCIPKLPFARLIKEIIQNVETRTNDLRLAYLALEALQESAEMFVVHMFEDADLCAAHAKRITVMVPDFKLAQVLRGIENPYSPS